MVQQIDHVYTVEDPVYETKHNTIQMETAAAVANFFIAKGIAASKEISPLKVQKLVYFAHGWHLAMYDEPLIDEVVQAWPYGPVVSSVYFNLQFMGNRPITALVRAFPGVVPAVCSDKEEFLTTIWRIYGKQTAMQLSDLTHQEGTPWDIQYNAYRSKGLSVPKGLTIPDEDIKQYFETLYQSAQAKSE